METTHPAPRVWSTVGYSDAFAHWREVVCQAFTKLSPERLNRDRFAGEIRLSDVGALGTLSEITAGPQTVERRRRDVAQRPCDAVFVNIQIAGGSIVRQRSIESHLTPGAFVMLDARQPFEMRFDRHFRQLCLHLPMALLDRHGFDPAPAIARAVKRDCVHGAAFMDSVGAVLDGVETEGDRDHLVELLRLCHAGGRNVPDSQRIDTSRRSGALRPSAKSGSSSPSCFAKSLSVGICAFLMSPLWRAG